MTRRGGRRPAALAGLVGDAVVVVAFAAAGRRSHDEAGGVAGTLEVAAPFLIALGATWMATRAWRDPDGLAAGVTVWAGTVAGGLALRALVFDRGVPPAFVVVAAITLGALLLGRRALATWWSRRGGRAPRPWRSRAPRG